MGPVVIVEAQEASGGSASSWGSRVKYRRRNSTRQCSCRMVPCSRSTKPLVKACRGLVRVWRTWSARQLLVEGALELAAAVGEDAPQRPAQPVQVRRHGAQEARGDRGSRLAEEERGPGVGRGGIAGGDLPDLADALEVPDVEAVHADELARLVEASTWRRDGVGRAAASVFRVRSVSRPAWRALCCSTIPKRCCRVPSPWRRRAR